MGWGGTPLPARPNVSGGGHTAVRAEHTTLPPHPRGGGSGNNPNNRNGFHHQSRHGSRNRHRDNVDHHDNKANRQNNNLTNHHYTPKIHMNNDVAAGHNNNMNENKSYRKLWQQVTAVERGGHLSNHMAPGGEGPHHAEATVEDLIEIVRRLPPEASAVHAVVHGLYNLDSGALAALLKELNKGGHSRRAQEIFDWLRGLDPSHALFNLANTMTYTTMISQCGSQQALRRALELLAEMRSRGIQCNVHTYSALMNVCIKANELDLALDVYRQMISEGCTPNLVTYNTLIDVYGKTGAWHEAVAVLDILQAQGIEPEVRTYNTVIIACNQSSRASEAVEVYNRMLATGAQPTATTYTALISAYGKAGQLEAALGIFQDMIRRGCERNVITYSSLISACEKAGKWELALRLFHDMHTEGCRPNVVTYNSLIAACAQGAQWQKAQELFDRMQHRGGCRPDSVTFAGLIAAYDRAGMWQQALAAFEQMRSMSCRSDTVVYNSIIGALWRTGLLWAQTRAVQIFHTACRQGHFRLTVHTRSASASGSASVPASGSPSLNRQLSGLTEDRVDGLESTDCTSTSPSSSMPSSPFSKDGRPIFSTPSLSPWPSPSRSNSLRSHASDELQCQMQVGQCSQQSLPTIEFGMHAFTVGSAVLSVMRWVGELRDRLPRPTTLMESAPSTPLPLNSVVLILNKGKPSREHTYPAIRAALLAMLKAWRSPFALSDIPQGCRIEAPATEASAWVHSHHAEAALTHFLDTNESLNPPGPGKDSNNALNAFNSFAQEDAVVEGRCSEAYAAVRQFEAAYERNAASKGLLHNVAGDDGGNTLAPSSPLDCEESKSSQERRKWFDGTAELAKAVGLSEEVLHDAFLLSERAITAASEPLGTNRLALAVACLATAARQGGEENLVAVQFQSVAGVAGLAPGEWETAMHTVSSLLNEDTASISALRVLKLYLERLGADFSSSSCDSSFEKKGSTLWPASGEAFALLPSALCDDILRHEPPSVVAAAVLMAGRKLAGISPFWPTTLERLTGMSADESSPLGKAAERVSKLVA